MAVPLIQSLAKEVSMNIIRRLPTDISCLSGVHQIAQWFTGKGRLTAAARAVSVVSSLMAVRTAPTRAVLLASPPAYVSDIRAKPIYRLWRLQGFALTAYRRELILFQCLNPKERINQR